jgi:hypothetical protein
VSGAAGNGGAAVNLRAWAAEAEAAAGIARALAPTPFIPEQLRRYVNPDERDPRKKQLDLEGTIATVTAVLLAGQELNFGPMASLRSITIIKGTVALYALAARALLLRAGHEIIVKESTSQRAIVDARRAGGEWQRSIWDIERARTAGLFPGPDRGNWRQNPKAMLVARATAEASRWVAADAMLGLPLIAEEVADSEFERPAELDEPPPAVPEQRTTKRRTPPKPRALPAGPPPMPPAPVPQEEPPPVTKPSKPQRDKMFAGLKELNITGRSEGLRVISAWVDRPIDSTNELTGTEISHVLDQIEVLIAARAADSHDEDQADELGQEGEDPPDAEPHGD